MNQGMEVIDLAMRIVGAKSLEMDRPLQRYYRDMRAGLHNPPMEDMAIRILLKVLQVRCKGCLNTTCYRSRITCCFNFKI